MLPNGYPTASPCYRMRRSQTNFYRVTPIHSSHPLYALQTLSPSFLPQYPKAYTTYLPTTSQSASHSKSGSTTSIPYAHSTLGTLLSAHHDFANYTPNRCYPNLHTPQNHFLDYTRTSSPTTTSTVSHAPYSSSSHPTPTTFHPEMLTPSATRPLPNASHKSSTNGPSTLGDNATMLLSPMLNPFRQQTLSESYHSSYHVAS